MTLQIVQDEAADEVLSTNAFALLCGMLLQQEVPVDVAFAGPAKILDRFGTLDPTVIAEATPEELAEVCATEPAIHPYPESMSVLIQAGARYVVANYGGDTASMWLTAGSGEHLLSRLMLMPGFNKRKAQMFIALLGKQLGVRPEGWERVAGPYAQPDSFRSVADVRDPESLARVRNAKSSRRKGSDDPGNDNSGHNQESGGTIHMTADEENQESTEEGGGRRVGKKVAAKKAAKRAANKERRRAEELADPELAAKRAAKRATRREEEAANPGGGREGNRRGGPGRGGRNRRAASDAPATDTPESGSQATTEDSPE